MSRSEAMEVTALRRPALRIACSALLMSAATLTIPRTWRNPTAAAVDVAPSAARPTTPSATSSTPPTAAPTSLLLTPSIALRAPLKMPMTPVTFSRWSDSAKPRIRSADFIIAATRSSRAAC